MTKVGLVVHRTFHSVSHSRNFRLFFGGQVVSATGTWMQSVASALLVFKLSGSGVALGVQGALNFGPLLVLGAWGGLLADRRDKRWILIVSQSAFALLAFALWGLVAAGVVRLWMVYALSFMQGLVTAADNPARQSFYAEMVGREHLTNAVSLNSAVMTSTRIVGPALAGLLVDTVGFAPCFLLNGLSYLAVIGALVAMRPGDLHRTAVPEARKGQLREGLTYIWRTPELRLPLLWMAAIFTFSYNFSVLFLLMAHGPFHGSGGTYGLLLSAMGVGSLVGALVMARQERPGPRKLAFAAVVFGIVTMIVAAVPSLWLELVVLVPCGLASAVFMITGNSTLQLTSQPEMRGRVMALYGIVFLGGTPFGAPIAGWVADRFGPRVGVGVGGVVAIATGLVGVYAVARRRLRKASATAAPAGAVRDEAAAVAQDG